MIKTSHTGLRRRHDTAVFEKNALRNGIPVWRQRSPLLLTEAGVLIAFFPRVGSILDPADKQGLAHYFEHMPGKGTRSYPSKSAITDFIRSRGGGRNATTDISWMRAYITMPASSYGDGVAVLNELVNFPLLRQEDVAVEKGIILSEHDRKYANGPNRAHRDIVSVLFKGHPLAQRPIGTYEGIAAVTLEDIRAFYDAYYHAGTMHLIVGGAFAERADVLSELENVFGKMPQRKNNLPAVPPLPAGRSGEVALTDSHYGRDLLAFRWLVPSGTLEESKALSLLLGAFANGIDAPLVVELREKLGLTYDTSLMGFGRMPYGWSIDANLTVPSEHFTRAQEVFFTTLRALSEERITKILARWQLDRLSEFTDPLNACFGAGMELVVDGEPHAYEVDERMEDAIDLETVWRWRERLLTQPPFIARVIANNTP